MRVHVDLVMQVTGRGSVDLIAWASAELYLPLRSALESRIMPEEYKLAASPILFSEGQFKGKLRCVAFSATSTSEARLWLAVNCGQFRRSFTKLVPDELAGAMVAALVRGDSIEFPGLRQEEEFDCGFAYLHNGAPVTLKASEYDRRLEQTTANESAGENCRQV